MIPSLVSCALAVSTLALPVRAASDVRVDSVSPHVASEVLYDDRGDGALYAVGRGWKARFDSDGASFIPFLGSDAPRSEIVRFRVREARVDGTVLALASSAGATRAGNTFTFARAGFEEIYTASLGGLEQSIVFHELPRRGEIVVRCWIETDLVSSVAGDAVEFRCARGGVRYSSAVAFDARGLRHALASRLEGDEIVLRVPAEVVRDAELPLTIDPFIETIGVASTTAEELAPDAAAFGEPTFIRRCEVWEIVWSQTDHDVTMRTAAFGPTHLHVIDASTEFWSGPKVASVVGAKPWTGSFDVVSAVGLPSSGARRIFGRTHGLYLELGAPVELTAGISGDHHSPDIGGDPFPGLNDYLLVWQRDGASGDHDVLGRQLSTGGGPSHMRNFADDPLHDDSRPSISTSNSLGLAGWAVVWERRVSPTNRDIWGSTCAYGPPTTPVAVSAAPEDELRPAVSSFDGVSRYVVAYQREVGGLNDVELRAFDGGTAGPEVDLAQLEGGAHAALDQVRPSIDGTSTGYLVAYKESNALVPGLYQTRLTSFALGAGGQFVVHEGHVPIGLATSSRTRASVSSESAQLGLTSASFEVVWDQLCGTSDCDVLAAYFVDGASSGSVVASCFGDGSDAPCPCASNGGAAAGCPNSAHPNGAASSWSGLARVGADSFQVVSTGLPSNSVALLTQGTSSVSPAVLFGDGLLCLGGSQTRIAARTAGATGDLSFPSVPSDPSISSAGGVPPAGGSRVYQLVYRDPASFCGPDNWNLSNALRVSWIP